SFSLETMWGGLGLRAPVVHQVLPLSSGELRAERLSQFFERVFVYYFFPLRLDAAAADLFLFLGGLIGLVLVSGLCVALGFGRPRTRFDPVYGHAVRFALKRLLFLRLEHGFVPGRDFLASRLFRNGLAGFSGLFPSRGNTGPGRIPRFRRQLRRLFLRRFFLLLFSSYNDALALPSLHYFLAFFGAEHPHLFRVVDGLLLGSFSAVGRNNPVP